YKVTGVQTCALPIFVGSLIGFICINGVTIRDYLWRYTESDWAYVNLQTVARMIPAAAQGDPYDVVIYRYNEGSFGDNTVYEMLRSEERRVGKEWRFR